MDSSHKKIILDATSANDLTKIEAIQSLWSGYGSIDRYRLSGAAIQSVVVKHVQLPQQSHHPRGWNTDISHQRKIRSYQVETAWYQSWASRCTEQCCVPHCYVVEQQQDETLMVLEDLDAAGFPLRKQQLNEEEMFQCLQWLAHFHAIFMLEKPQGLWPTGTYWHLQTRPHELEAMPEGALKRAAFQLDQVLENVPFQTFVHGDAKVANFCFSADAQKVAAVDFQYVGGGCGMKDVAYFIGSCLNETECEQQETVLLDAYFTSLGEALALHQPVLNAAEIEAAWRPLYAVAWTDFYRFLQGWSPGHWKIHRYSEQLAKTVISELNSREISK